MIAAEMMPAVGLRPHRQAGGIGRGERREQFGAGDRPVDGLRHRAVGEREPRDAVPPVAGEFDQLMIEAEPLPLLALGADHLDELGVVDRARSRILGQSSGSPLPKPFEPRQASSSGWLLSQ